MKLLQSLGVYSIAAMISAHLGELAALAAAGFWAISTLWFRHSAALLPPLQLNLCKNVLALVMLALTAWLLRVPPVDVRPEPLALLLISGAIGIGIGDSAFFAALNRIGERRCLLIVETLAPVLTIAIAYAWLQEHLPRTTILAVCLVLVGIAWALSDHATHPPSMNTGLFFGFSAALCQAIGAVLSRQALTASGLPVLWSTMVRLAGGLLLIGLLTWHKRKSFDVSRGTFSTTLLGRILPATLLGTYLGIFLQQLALKHASAGVVQTLLASSSVLIAPLAALSGERFGNRAWTGALLAFLGIFLLFQN